MAERSVPGLGLTAFWDLGGGPWKTGMDQNLLALSALCQLNVISRDTTLPASPADGVVYINPESAPSYGGQVAARDNGAWAYFQPVQGWTAWVEDEQVLVVFDGSGWKTLQSFNPTCFAVCDYDAYIASATWTTVPLNTAPVDPRSDFNTSTNTYTASAPGVYEVSVRGEFELNSVAATAMSLRVMKNGSAVSGSTATGLVTAAGGLVSGSALVSLDAGDTVTMECQMTGSDGYLLSDSAAMTVKMVG